MNSSHLRTVVLLAGSVLAAPLLTAQQSPASGTAVHMVVTAEARHGTDVPVIQKEDVMIYQGRDRVKATDGIPLQGDHAELELFLLLVGVGYMRNGTVDIVQNLTNDHNKAATSLRLPSGDPGVNASPYFSASDLIKGWPDSPVRREILMVSDGIDRYGIGGASDPYVDQAVEQAQRAGIVIFSIYSPGADHFGHTFWRINWGQNYLSKLILGQAGQEGWDAGRKASHRSFECGTCGCRQRLRSRIGMRRQI